MTYKPHNPNHPQRRMRDAHAAVLEVVKPGTVIPMKAWLALLTDLGGVTTDRAAYGWTASLERLGLLEHRKRRGVVLLPATAPAINA